MSRTLVLSLFILIYTASTAPRASETKQPTATMLAAQSVVQASLVEPLKHKEEHRSRFSRAFLPPMARRVRILDEAVRKDEKGAAFVTFAIDARYGLLDDEKKPDWQMGAVSGCVYPDTQEVFVVRGAAHFPAGLLLGKRVQAAPAHVCHGASAQRDLGATAVSQT